MDFDSIVFDDETTTEIVTFYIRELNVNSQSFYSQFDRFDCIYCFRADQLTTILQNRSQFVEDGLLMPYLSLQEMLGIWCQLGCSVYSCFITEDRGEELFPYYFISHMHSRASEDKLGEDVIRSISMMGSDIVWMDLCSMFQANILEGYSYDLHTRPVVERLHLIANQAEEGRVLLNPSESKSPDPSEIRLNFELFYSKLFAWKHYEYKRYEFQGKKSPKVPYDPSSLRANESEIKEIIQTIEEVWNSAELCHTDDGGFRGRGSWITHGEGFGTWSNKRYTTKFPRTGVEVQNIFQLRQSDFDRLERAFEKAQGLALGWFPVDEYFGRLWCYVERLSMKQESIFVYPGNQSNRIHIDFEEHLRTLWDLFKLLASMTGACIDPSANRKQPFCSRANVSLSDLHVAEALLISYTHRCRQLFGGRYTPHISVI